MRSFKISVLAGHTHIVKILAPLTDNPNAPTKWGDTPYSVTRDAKIQRILESFNSSGKQNAGQSGKPSTK